ncbi:response regulator, partial [Myxococcota bacterium]|nr:response regulator [Myxococcota bacterium]
MPGTVLIVDADLAFTEPTQQALEAAGLTVHVRDDAPIDLIRKLRPHVMMVNVELPRGASGFAICGRIRRDRELKSTPILLTAGEATVEALKKHAASPDRADDYAKKPVAIDDVVARLGRMLANVVVNEPAKAPEPAAPALIDDRELDDAFEDGARADGRPALLSAPSIPAASAAPPGPPPVPSR